MSEYFSLPSMSPVFDFIAGRNRSFYIPAYQRPFSWDNSKIKRLFEDIVEDMGNRMIYDTDNGKRADMDTVSFIGTVVCFEDRDYKTIHPYVVNQVPQDVHTVIDGQQRLTVLMISAVVLHSYIRERQNKVENEYLREKCVEIMDDLASVTESVRQVGTRRHYPRMIRAFEDQWSTNTDDSIYDSPISYYVSCYGDFCRQDDEKPFRRFTYDGGAGVTNLDNNQQRVHADFKRAVQYIERNIVKDICKGNTDTFSFPNIEDIFGTENEVSKAILKDLFNTTQQPPDILSTENSKQHEIARALLLSAYLMKKVYFVSLVTKDENYAFDIFDSLNTTGEPLTAYETFKPVIIRFEDLENFRHSESKKHTDVIDSYTQSRENDRAKATSELLVSFALAENGTNLSKKLHVQRKHLINRYTDISDQEKRIFTRHMQHVSEVWEYLWYGRVDNADIIRILNCSENPSLLVELSQARFCINFLKDARHTIAIALIARFYEEARLSPGNTEKTIAVCKTIKSITAFFVMWRISREHTDGIDNLYRQMMATGISQGDNADHLTAFCWKKEASISVPKVQESFRYLMREVGGSSRRKFPLSDSAQWIEYSSNVPVYRTAKAVAKCVLLLATHDAGIDERKPGILIPGQEGVYPLIKGDTWHDEAYETVEHINPRVPSEEGDNNVHVDDLNRIGNLTLLPKGVNSIVSNRPWGEKRLIYRMLSAETLDEFDSVAEKVVELGISGKSIENLRRVRYLRMTRAVSMRDEFGTGDIEGRGNNILKMAWRVLSDWLDFDSD